MIEKTHKIAISWDSSGGSVAVDGKLIVSVTAPVPVRKLRPKIYPDLDPSTLCGPKLKVERAKEHIAELEALVRSFNESKPHEFFVEKDDKTGEDVIRVRIHKAVPKRTSIIVGDAVHNLRSALDQLVCDLIVANGKQIRRGSGFRNR